MKIQSSKSVKKSSNENSKPITLVGEMLPWRRRALRFLFPELRTIEEEEELLYDEAMLDEPPNGCREASSKLKAQSSK